MEQCYKCGEHKKVREIRDVQGRFMKNPIFDFSYWYDYICEDCSKALATLKKEEHLKKQKAWIKQRDEILKDQVDYVRCKNG